MSWLHAALPAVSDEACIIAGNICLPIVVRIGCGEAGSPAGERVDDCSVGFFCGF